MEAETQSTEVKSTEVQATNIQGTEVQDARTPSGPEGLLARLTARLSAAVDLLERAVPLAGISASETLGPIVAMVDNTNREAELAQKLAAAEKTIAELRASSTAREGRRTLPVSLLAKQDGGAPEPGAIDAALVSLSLEQRLAVKAQLLRSGLI